MITIKFENEILPIKVDDFEVKEYEINGELKIFGIGPFSVKSNIEVKDKQTGKIADTINDIPAIPFLIGAFTASINAVQDRLAKDGIFVVKPSNPTPSKDTNIITIPFNIENEAKENFIVQKLKGEVRFRNSYIEGVRGPIDVNITIEEIELKDKDNKEISLREEQIKRAIAGALTKIVMAGEISEKELSKNIVNFLNVEYTQGKEIDSLIREADKVLNGLSLKELEKAITDLVNFIKNKK